MSKKLMAIAAVVVLTLALATTAWAASAAPRAGTQMNGYSNGGCGGYARACYNLMRDADGNIVSKDVFEKNLDDAIAAGTILEADRDYYIEMYDYCSVNGGIAMGGGRGRGCGGGMRQAVPNY